MTDLEQQARTILIQNGMHEDTNAGFGFVPYGVVVRAMLAFRNAQPGEGLLDAAVNQNDAMRQELATVGNLVSDLARALKIDQDNEDDSWPNLSGRIRKLIEGALAKPRPDREAVIKQAAQIAYRICAETRHLTLGDKVRDAILTLLPAEPVQEMREGDTARTIEILRRALAWHGDPQRMATTREEWQQEIDAAIAWVKANPEEGRPSFSSLGGLLPSGDGAREADSLSWWIADIQRRADICKSEYEAAGAPSIDRCELPEGSRHLFAYFAFDRLAKDMRAALGPQDGGGE